MARSKRQLKMIEIIKNNNVETQIELTELLLEAGFNVTQATVSRDIKELGITKIMTPTRRYKYVYKTEEAETQDKFVNLFKQSVVSIKSAMNIIVIKTVIGSANSAAAFIDKLDMIEIIGTLAGDDTILLIASDQYATDNIKRKLNSYLI